MGTLTIYFVGICTHFWQEPGSGKEHRIVLVNASKGDEPKKIKPHHAKLLVHEKDIVDGQVPRLDGVTMRVKDVTSALEYHRSYSSCIPSLKTYADEPIEPDDGVTHGKDSEKAAAYFDVKGGMWRAGLDGPDGAAAAYVRIETASAQPTLLITRFHDAAIRELTLADNAVIQVQNVGTRGDDADNDFLLHFRTARPDPANPRWPKKGDLKCEPLVPPLPFPGQTVGPGCSNSNYP